MSLYQKYRPRDFDSLVGQDFVKISLKNALKQDKLVGAYLFYGSRGTGKTTTARILAKGFNCINLREDGNPCLECDNCKAFENEEAIDVIEIDAASNTGVDNIRDLIEKAQFQPNFSKFKVYIIDEVHMLSKGAFNALLKTLEEPPKHVKFILATTEVHKIPDTIISRTQRYDFKKIQELDIIDRLRFISHNEGVDSENEALSLIARLSKGGLRDAISLFEQYSIGGNLKLDYLKSNLQLVGDEFILELISDLKSEDLEKTKNNLLFLKDKGIDIKIFLEEFLYLLHEKTLNETDSNTFVFYIELYDCLIEIYQKIKTVPNAFLFFEFSIFRFLKKGVKADFCEKKEEKISINKKNIEDISTKNKTTSDIQINKTEIKNIIPEKKEEKIDVISKTNTEESEPALNNENIQFNLQEFFESIKKDSGKGFILMSLKASEIIFKNNMLTIYANNEFNYNKLQQAEIIGYISTKLKEVFSIINATIDLKLDKSDKIKNNIISDALDVF